MNCNKIYPFALIYLIFCFLGTTGCQPIRIGLPKLQTPAGLEVTQTPDLFTDGIRSKFVIETIPMPTLPNEAIVVEGINNGDVAATFCHEKCEVIVFLKRLGYAQKISSSSFAPGRPFSNLQWMSEDVVAFDQWSQPHYGLHYQVNMDRAELLSVTPLTDHSCSNANLCLGE